MCALAIVASDKEKLHLDCVAGALARARTTERTYVPLTRAITIIYLEHVLAVLAALALADTWVQHAGAHDDHAWPRGQSSRVGRARTHVYTIPRAICLRHVGCGLTLVGYALHYLARARRNRSRRRRSSEML